MENTHQPLDNLSFSKSEATGGLQVTDLVKKYWKELVLWTRGFAVLIILNFMSTLFSTASNVSNGKTTWASQFISLAISAALSALLAYYLFVFASSTSRALASDEEENVTKASRALRSYYITVGVVVIFVLGLFTLLFLGLLVAGGRY
jgi:hypothetical protein